MYYPNAFSIIFFILFFYLLFSSEGKSAKFSFLLLIIYCVLLFTHPLTPAILTFLLIALFSVSKSLKLKNVQVDITLILIMIVSLLAKWMYTRRGQENVFKHIVLSVKDAFEVDNYTSVASVTLSQMLNFQEILLYDLGYTILILLGIIGVFYTLRKV
jgi:uncharacterized membrane protein